MHRASGFTLIELVIVMIVISVGLLGLVGAFSNASRSLTTNETLQQATQYAQECAESVMAKRRDFPFASFALPGLCNGTITVTSVTFNRSATLGGSYDTTSCTGHFDPTKGVCPCPSGGSNNCRDVAINVTSGSLSSSITLMLVDY